MHLAFYLENTTVASANKSNKKLALPCTIAMGAFSSERVFTITLANGDTYQSAASFLHFWDAKANRLNRTEPGAGNRINGLVAARLVKQDGDDLAVEVPDGEVVMVSTKSAVRRPQEADTNVPVGSGHN